ncbi:MAG: sulfotransferase [Myxococcota bacterium]
MAPSTIEKSQRRGDPAAALGLVTAHLSRNPHDDAAWAVAAEALVRLERPEEAVEAARRAQRPGAPERQALLAWALASAGAAAEARGWLARLGPEARVPGAWERAARAHDRLGEPEAAVAAHGRAVQLAPTDLGCALRFAERLERAGDPRRASMVIADVLDQRPSWEPARRVRVRLLARTGDLDGAASEARVLLDGNELSPAVTTGLMLELARIEARRGAVESTVEWAELGNRRALEVWRAEGGDPDRLWQELDALANATLRDPPRHVPPSRPLPNGQRPAFIVGFPRSGTTLVQRMIEAHSSVVTFDEAPLLDRALAEVLPGLGWVDIARRAAEPDIAQRIRQAWWSGAARRIGGVPKRPGLVVDKLPLNLLRLDVIVRAFPDAPIVLVVRDPRDAVLSAWLQDFRLNLAMAQFTSLERTARLFDRALATWFRVTPTRGIALRYEALLDDPESVWRPIVDAMGLPWDPAILGARDQSLGKVHTPSYAAIRQPLNRGSVGRWRPFAATLRPVHHILAPWLERFGYG